MFCYYSHGHNAYLKIIPYKVETVSLDPRVDLYYDVLSDYEIDVIKELATPRVNLMPYDQNKRLLNFIGASSKNIIFSFRIFLFSSKELQFKIIKVVI